jgi:hypothetical protein
MMVCRFDDERLLLVLQIDHSRVAGFLASHWGNHVFARPRPYLSVVLAAQEHDSSWWEWEARPEIDASGHPIDYADGGVDPARKTVFDRVGIARVAEQDPYAGLLVGMHIAGLCCQRFDTTPHLPDKRHVPEVWTFLREQEATRNQWLADLRESVAFRDFATDEEVWRNYRLVQIYDQVGQILCNRYPFNTTERRTAAPTVLRHAPVAPGEDDVTLHLDIVDEVRAIVRPYPFDVSPLRVTFPARLVPKGPYRSQDEFLGEFYRGERIALTRTLQAD